MIPIPVPVPVPTMIPQWLRVPIDAPGIEGFPVMMVAALCLLAWVIFLYDPGSASHDSGQYKDN
jgi:hypothetical protein